MDSAATVLTASEVTSVEDGLAALERAAALWSDSAWLWYLQGRALSQLEKPQEALAAFVRARDLDTMPWRAPSAYNEVIRSLAAEDILLADIEKAFRDASPPEGIGWELMSDHVHPSVDGQILMARTMLRAFRPLLEEQPTSLEKNPQRCVVPDRIGRSAGRARRAPAHCRRSTQQAAHGALQCPQRAFVPRLGRDGLAGSIGCRATRDRAMDSKPDRSTPSAGSG